MNFIFHNTIKIILIILFSIVLLHVLVISKNIPYDVIWGGRLKNDTEMYFFETISILVNMFLAWVLLMKTNLLKFRFSNRIINIILWIFFGLFILNTIGNIFAKTTFEKFLALLTGLLSILIWNIIMPKKIINHSNN